jgi:hypothetical protein
LDFVKNLGSFTIPQNRLNGAAITSAILSRVPESVRMASFGGSRTTPQRSVPSSPSDLGSPIRPRRPSLEPPGDILSTRGQYLSSLIRRRSFSSQKSDGFFDAECDDTASFRDRERPAVARARDLIGERRPSYNWYIHHLAAYTSAQHSSAGINHANSSGTSTINTRVH